MPSNSIISKNEKLEKIVLEIKSNLKNNLKKLSKKFKKISLTILDWKKKIEAMLPKQENQEEKSDKLKDVQNQAPIEIPEDNEESEEVLEQKRKREVIFEMVLFLVLGILLGITIKTEAVKRITIGFNDYKVIEGKNGYNLQDLEKKLKQQVETSQNQSANNK